MERALSRCALNPRLTALTRQFAGIVVSIGSLADSASIRSHIPLDSVHTCSTGRLSRV